MGESKELNNAPTPETVRDLTAEQDRLRAEVAELRRALDDARQKMRDKDAIVAERDMYLEHLEIFWAEKIAEMDKNGIDFGEVVAEIEQDFQAREQMNAERERFAQEVGELRKQLGETQRQLDSWKEKARHSEEQVALLEKDWHSMFRLLPREYQVTEEDIKEIQRDPHTFEELFREWEQK